MIKKILFISHEFPPMIGGAGQFALAKFKKLRSCGHHVKLLTIQEIELTFYSHPLPFIANIIKKYLWPFYYLLYILQLQKGYDCIVCNDPPAIYSIGLLSYFIKSQIKCFFHGDEFESIFKSQSLFRRLIFFKYFYLKGIYSSSTLAFSSSHLKSKILPFLGCIDNISILIEHPIVNTQLFKPLPSSSRFWHSHISLEDNINKPNIIISVSRVVEQKGYKAMLLSFLKYKKFFIESNSHWVIAGSGDYLSELVYQVNKFELQTNVHFLGNVENFLLPQFYSNSMLFWLYSLYDESFGISFKEASMCGLPVYSRDCPGVKEALDTQKNCFFYNSCDDSILDIAKHIHNCS